MKITKTTRIFQPANGRVRRTRVPVVVGDGVDDSVVVVAGTDTGVVGAGTCLSRALWTEKPSFPWI